MKSILFNIQKYSIHDGPGIRTIVFIKGCPLKCVWCSNPESQVKTPQVVYFNENCIDCEKCINVCIKSALKKINDSISINRNICDNCGLCVEICPSNSLRFWGKEYSVDDVIKEVKKDYLFYRKSGGGVTISGGEPLVEPEFTLELLKKLKENFIDTAIETCGFGKWEDLNIILDYTDTVFYDIKHINPSKHRQYTGIDNKIILDNLKNVVKYHKLKMILRVPLIPDYNDENENIEGIFKLVHEMEIKEIHFLPYHGMGESKYDKLDIDYTLKNLRTEPNKFYLNKLKNFIIKNPEIKVQIGG